MNLGEKIKNRRIALGLTQEELAERAELTKGFISQLERDLTSPGVETLADILEALGTDLSDFFKKEEEAQVAFHRDDAFSTLDQERNSRITWVVPNAQKNQMEPIVLEIEPGGSSREYLPGECEDFGYVVQGRIQLIYGKENHLLRTGECFYTDCTQSRQLRNPGKRVAKVLWISTPPIF